MIVQSAKVLRELRKISDSSDTLLTFVRNAPHIAVFKNTDIFYDYTEFEKEILALIEDLKNNGYLQEGFNNTNFVITAKGLHPYRYSWEILKVFLFKSVLVPIVVSVITTLITLWLRVQL